MSLPNTKKRSARYVEKAVRYVTNDNTQTAATVNVETTATYVFGDNKGTFSRKR